MTTVQPSMLALKPDPSVFKPRHYAHLDSKRSPQLVESLAQNPRWVSKHGFLPFIHAVIKQKRRQGKRKPPKWKDRNIYYASHMDRYIYQWYAHLTGEAYERYIADNKFAEAPIAYRQGLHKTNVHFAKEAFDFIRSKERCFVYITDFESFFDTLSHGLLKDKLKKVFDVPQLPQDHYHVFRSMTAFRFFDLADIASVLSTTVKMLRGSKTKPPQLIPLEQMRSLKKTFLRKNDNKDPFLGMNGKVGVPQGSPISAVYANVYLIDFDQAMTEFTREVGGYYRRYSDDLICVVPTECETLLRSKIDEQVSIARVSVSAKKTKLFKVTADKVRLLNDGNPTAPKAKVPIEYLGLSFDGESIRLKEATLNKYYNRLNRRLHLMRIKSVEFGKVIGRRKTYKKYSHLGEANRREMARRSGREPRMKDRNFFSYAYGAVEIAESRVIKDQLKGHFPRIRDFYRTIERSVGDQGKGS